MTGGSSGIRTFMKAVNTANAAAYDTVEDWLEQKNAVHQESGDTWRKTSVQNIKRQRNCLRDANLFLRCLMVSEPPAGMKREEFVEKAADVARDCETPDDLREYLEMFAAEFKGDWKRFLNKYRSEGKKPFSVKVTYKKTEESISHTNLKHLNEKGLISDDFDKEDDEDAKNSPLVVDYDKVYNDLLVSLSTAMSEAVGPRADWLCFKGIAD